MKKKAFLNIACSSMSQIVAIVTGLIVPRLLLSTFGSEANGLVSSLTQFLNYIALIEGGIGSVVLTAMYGPLARQDHNELSRVIQAAARFFKQIAYIFVGYTVILAVLYPFVVESSFSWLFVSSLTIILSLSLFIQYFFSITYRLLLQADQKMYVVQVWQIIISILNLCVVVISIKVCPELHIVKLCSVLLFAIQPVAYGHYVKKHYHLSKKVVPDTKTLSQRWAGFGQNFAYFIHSNTDVIVLSLFCDLKTVSVYSVYMLVIKHVQGFFRSFSHAFSPMIGKDIALGDYRSTKNHLDIYEFTVVTVATIVYGCCIYLLPSFALLYTHGINDSNYYRPIFSTIILLAEYVYCIREPYVATAFAAGKFKETEASAYIEALINVVLSIILVRRYGLEGIAVGTLAGMLYRMIYLICFVRKNILNRSVLKPIKRAAIAAVTIFISISCINFLDRTGSLTVLLWIKNAVVSVTVFTVVTIVLDFVFDKPLSIAMLKRLRKRN